MASWATIVCALASLIAGSAAAEYYGSTVGAMRTLHHQVAGQVFIVDRNRIFIKGFTYDGTGPDAFFYIGTSGNPSNQGTQIADENGSNDILGKYTGKDLVLTLPANVNAGDVAWLSVWCKAFAVDFGHITFASNLVVPAPMSLGPLRQLAHGVSGQVMLMDTRTLVIKQLMYDGQGPDAYFWVGTSHSPDTSGTIINNENGSKDILKKYDGSKDITLMLDESMSWRELRWLSVWCKAFTVDFGSIIIRRNLAVPPYISDGGEENQDKQSGPEEVVERKPNLPDIPPTPNRPPTPPSPNPGDQTQPAEDQAQHDEDQTEPDEDQAQSDDQIQPEEDQIQPEEDQTQPEEDQFQSDEDQAQPDEDLNQDQFQPDEDQAQLEAPDSASENEDGASEQPDPFGVPRQRGPARPRNINQHQQVNRHPNHPVPRSREKVVANNRKPNRPSPRSQEELVGMLLDVLRNRGQSQRLGTDQINILQCVLSNFNPRLCNY